VQFFGSFYEPRDFVKNISFTYRSRIYHLPAHLSSDSLQKDRYFLNLAKSRVLIAVITRGGFISDVLSLRSHIKGIDKVLDLVETAAPCDGDDVKPCPCLEESVFPEEP